MKKAFTLIELLVSLSILAVLSAIMLMHPGQGSEEYKIINAAHLVVTDIGKTQNFALSVKEFNFAVPQGGWGTHIEKNKSCYIIFADVDGDRNYNAGSPAEIMCDASATGSPERSERVFLPKTVTVFSITVDGVAVSALNVVFLPPRPDMYINTSAGKTAVITLKSTALGTVKTITVNSVGHISAQ